MHVHTDVGEVSLESTDAGLASAGVGELLRVQSLSTSGSPAASTGATLVTCGNT